jgi:type IV secretory pathway TraG/TraD family ATPase VirD4
MSGLGGYYGIGTDLLPIGIGILFLLWRLRRDTAGGNHIRGLRLLTSRQHYHQLRPYPRRLLTAINRPMGGRGAKHKMDIRLGSSLIPEQKIPEHFLVTGSPGSGKSTLIRQLLQQIQKRGDPAIVFDVEGESTMEFYDESRGDVILNSLDARCPFWSPWLEFRQETAAMDREAMAASLIRDQPRTSTERFFLESGRTVLESIFQVASDNEPAALNAFLALPREEMHELLRSTPAFALVDPNTRETGQSIIATAINAAKPLQHLPRRPEVSRQWTAHEWAHERRGWIFLPSTAGTQAAIQSLQGVWMDCLVRHLMDGEISDNRICWIIADELPALEYQPMLERLVTRGRKRGLAVVMGFQNVSQLRKIYGP